MELMFAPLRKYATFDGRARRREFWLFTLLIVALVFFFEGIALFGQSHGDTGLQAFGGLGVLLVLLLTIIPGTAVRVRRLHDIDQSGWVVLVGVIPFVGFLILLVLSLIDGTPRPNRFGRDPKGRGYLDPSQVAQTFS